MFFATSLKKENSASCYLNLYCDFFVIKQLTIWYSFELLCILVLEDSFQLSTAHDRVLPKMFKILQPQKECIVCHNFC